MPTSIRTALTSPVTRMLLPAALREPFVERCQVCTLRPLRRPRFHSSAHCLQAEDESVHDFFSRRFRHVRTASRGNGAIADAWHGPAAALVLHAH